MITSLKKLLLLLSKRTLKNIPFILLSILLIGILEMLSVLLLTPLLTSIQEDSAKPLNAGLQQGVNFVFEIFKVFNIASLKDIAIFLVIFMLVKHIVIIFLNYFQYRTIFDNDIWLRNTLLERYSNLSYVSFSSIKSSELIRNTAEQVGQISYGALLSILTIVSEVIVSLALLSLIFFTIPIGSSLMIIVIFCISILPFYIFKRRMVFLGKVRFDSVGKTISEIQNLYHLHIEIKLYDIRKYFLNRVKVQSVLYSNAQIQYNVINNLPKGLIEISAVLIILILLLNTKNDGSFLPIMGIIITSIFRITPSLTRIASALTQLKFSVEQINILHEAMFLNFKEETVAIEQVSGISFENRIKLENIDFGYGSNKALLKNFNLEICKGDFVILKGKSGKGKSTIFRILMGLIQPNMGKVIIDGTDLTEINRLSWYKKIGYVPQKPVIIEGTLLENICLGIDSSGYSIANYDSALKNAQLEEFKLEFNDIELSSEGGSISGGQAQRIGIARALYRNPEVLFLDEPTSALDSKNAYLIISLLSKLNLENEYTIIMISHSDEFDSYATKIVQL